MKKSYLLLTVGCGLWAVSAHAATIDAGSAKTIEAPKIEYNLKSETIKTTGETKITNAAGQRMTLVDSYISQKGAVASANDIEISLSRNIRITAESMDRSDGNTIATHATYTACYECDEHGIAWEFSARKIKHDSEDKMIRFYDPVLWLYGIPIAWFPYLENPDPSVKYKSGILFPYINSTNGMGTQINVPIYINFSDTHDLTFTPSYLTGENPLFQIEHRLNADHSEFRTIGSFTRNKDGDNRWAVFNKDVIEMGNNVRTTVFVERASDKTYLQKYLFYADQPYLDSGAKTEVFGESGYIVADMHMFQELRTDLVYAPNPSGNILPQISGTLQTRPLIEETYASFNADVLSVDGQTTSSQRMIGEGRITSPWTLPMGLRFTTSAAARYDIYRFDNTTMIDGATYTGMKNRFLPSGYAELGLPLIRNSDDGWTQMIEPRARLTVMQHVANPAYAENNDSAGAILSDATLFSDNRFAGLDLWENGTYSDYGMRWTAFDDNNRNIEVFAGQTYDFKQQEKTDPDSGFRNGASDYVGRIGYSEDMFGLIGRFRVGATDTTLKHMENMVRLGSTRNYLNLGHIWAVQLDEAQTLENRTNELTAGVRMHLTERLSIGGYGIYNVTDHFFQRHTGGLFYEHPCYSLSLEYFTDNAVKYDFSGNTTFRLKFAIKMTGDETTKN